MFKRVLSLILALVLCGAMAVTGIGETEEPAEAEVAAETEAEAVEEPEAAEETEEAEAAPATLEEALARIAELEALLEQYKPVYDEQVIVEYDGGIVLRDEVMKVYQQYVDMFAQYGLDLASYGMDQQYKEQSADEVLEKKILEAKAVELGADQLSDEELDEIAQSAQKTFDGYVESVASQMAEKQGVDVTDEIRQSAVDYLNNLGGYSVSDIEASLKENAVTENLYEMVTADVEVTEEDVRAAYDAEVERQQESYADSYTYINDRDNGTQIVWNPAGYRAVKQVLIKFDDDQSAKYKELNDKKTALEAELAELLEPAEEEPAEEELTREPVLEAPVEEEPSDSTSDEAEPSTTTTPAVSQEQAPASASQEKEDAPVFKIQILASDKKLKSNDRQLKGLSADYYQEGKLYKYTYGNTTDYREIQKLHKSLNGKFPGSFIIAFKNGNKVATSQAINEWKKKNKR